MGPKHTAVVECLRIHEGPPTRGGIVEHLVVRVQITNIHGHQCVFEVFAPLQAKLSWSEAAHQVMAELSQLQPRVAAQGRRLGCGHRLQSIFVEQCPGVTTVAHQCAIELVLASIGWSPRQEFADT